MTIKLNGALRRCLAGSALGALIAFAFVPAATAQWLPPWRARASGEIERSLEAQGYVLTAPLMRRPGVYLADVSAGPAGYQRLIIDARSGQILERFALRAEIGAPRSPSATKSLASLRPAASGRRWPAAFSGRPTRPGGKIGLRRSSERAYSAAVSPYGAAEAPAGTKPKPKSASTERKAPATGPPTINPPLPPPAPRETAKADGSGSPAPKPDRGP